MSTRVGGIEVKIVLCPVLANLDVNKTFEVFSDASDTAIGTVLQQEGKPVEYVSRALRG